MKVTVTKYIYLLIFFNTLFSVSLQAQVTIGSLDTPNASALLDLKNQSNGTSTKGLLLPRFTVTNVNTFGLAGNSLTAGMSVYSAANAGNTGAGIYTWNGSSWLKSVTSADVPIPISIPTNGAGTVIAVDGKLQIAQEITYLMETDEYDYTANAATAIPFITKKVVDTHNAFTGTTSGNSFTVQANGVYQLMMNVQIQVSSGNPVLGIWDNTANSWVARVSNVGIVGPRFYQTLSIDTAVNLTAGKTYSFRLSNSSNMAIYGNSGPGFGGNLYTSFFSLRRIR